jgi:cyclase
VPHTPQAGWIAVSLWRLLRDRDYLWLRTFEPVARIGTSINLYHITDEAAVAKLAPVVIELAPGIYMRDKKGLHGSQQAFIEFDSYVVVFDPSTVIQARQLLAEIRARTSKPVRYVVISHFHPDHSAGAAVFAATGAEVVAAAAARRDFDNWVREDFAAKLLQQPVDYRGLTYSPPTRYVENTWVLDDGKQRLELTHFGHGHTSGDLVGWMPKPRILFAGDLSTDGYLNLANANMNGWIAVLDKLRALQPRLVMRGHGHLGGPEALEDTQKYLVEMQEKMRELMERGMTFEEIVAWYRRSPMRNEIADLERAYAEAGGTRDRSQPLVTKKRAALLVGLGVTILSFLGFLYWKRRRSRQ